MYPSDPVPIRKCMSPGRRARVRVRKNTFWVFKKYIRRQINNPTEKRANRSGIKR
jgi:hypothetical protein